MANSKHAMVAFVELVRDVTESYRSCTFADIWYYSQQVCNESPKNLKRELSPNRFYARTSQKGVAIKKSTISMTRSLVYVEFQLTLQTSVKEREGGWIKYNFLSPVYPRKTETGRK